jgi:serine/threonine-protein kinase
MPRPEDPSPALSAPAPELPKRIGPYDILETLGRGGMGVVYKALDARLNRPVAVKVLPAPAMKSRFQREALAVARLQHPNIVQIYDIGEHEGLAYVVLEFVRGGSLAQKLRKEALAPRAAAQTVATLARALQHAHDQGIIHRDMKPSNVLLTSDGQPKIADFGLAKVQELANEDPARTHEGMILGTPSYMAPEQAAGNVTQIGPAADIYSLGAILYELLTGRPPFRGENIMGTLSQLATQKVIPPHALNPAVDDGLSAICLKCLEKDWADRYPSANGLAEDLEAWLEGRSSAAQLEPQQPATAKDKQLIEGGFDTDRPRSSKKNPLRQAKQETPRRRWWRFWH